MARIEPLTPQQVAYEAELAAALPKQPAVIRQVVRWAAALILSEREACAKMAQAMGEERDDDSCREVATAIRARE